MITVNNNTKYNEILELKKGDKIQGEKISGTLHEITDRETPDGLRRLVSVCLQKENYCFDYIFLTFRF